MTFEQIEKALDAGKLEMMRPWGDYVRVRRREVTRVSGPYKRIEIFMENQVMACISTTAAKFNWNGYRVVK